MIRIGITTGDVNGIGPEVALKAAARRWPRDLELVLVGSERVLREQARSFRLGVPAVWDPLPHFPLVWRPGRLDPRASRAAAEWISAATHACLGGGLDGMVTAPISKEGFHAAGLHVPGHTELLAQLTGSRRFAMMLFGGPLRVVLATRHVPIADVPRLLTRRAVSEAIDLTAKGLPWLGSRRARIAVCGLNPHAGEGGDIGREEITTIAPVVRAHRRRGQNVHGPLPADTVFHHAARGDYDAVVAMYHDQGLAPLKLLAFETGVNVTLGLPMVRTSPDHGTAFDIAARGIANPDSMMEAVRWAYALAKKRNPWGAG
jgi:4-hydroxythreonine-4-phosphate dehydrogenase